LEQPLPGWVDQFQDVSGIKGEQGSVDFLDHSTQERGGFDCSYSLVRQQISQRVDFDREFAEGVVGGGAAARNE